MSRVICCLIVFLILLYVPAVNLSTEVQDQKTYLYIAKGNVFNSAFTEPFEILYVFMADGSFYALTNKMAGFVAMPIKTISNLLKEDGRNMSEVVSITHNHFKKPGFSKPDEDLLRILRSRGFQGEFNIYFTPTGEILKHKDN